ncbi:hypothetical protein [Lysinibacillus sp. BNK-21]|uniref:hypothetical protein n=1 Tax=Lysinibacillus sp. BNK-21 TaxID=3376156 RepID=UPI003B43CA93
MSIVQLSMFDCEVNMRNNDYVYRQLEALQIGSNMRIGNIQVSRTEKFYVVAKEAEFEEVFNIFKLQKCYEFINEKLMNK